MELCGRLIQRFCETCSHLPLMPAADLGDSSPQARAKAPAAVPAQEDALHSHLAGHVQYAAFQHYMELQCKALRSEAPTRLEASQACPQVVQSELGALLQQTCAMADVVVPVAHLDASWALLDRSPHSANSPFSRGALTPMGPGVSVAVSSSNPCGESSMQSPAGRREAYDSPQGPQASSSMRTPSRRQPNLPGQAPGSRVKLLPIRSPYAMSATSASKDFGSCLQSSPVRLDRGEWQAWGSKTADVGAVGVGVSGQAARRSEQAQQQRFMRNKHVCGKAEPVQYTGQPPSTVSVDVPAQLAVAAGASPDTKLQNPNRMNEGGMEHRPMEVICASVSRSFSGQSAVVAHSALAPAVRLTNTSESDPAPNCSNIHTHVQAVKEQLQERQGLLRTVSHDTMYTDSTPVLGTPGMPDIAMAHARMAAGRHAPREPSGFRTRENIQYEAPQQFKQTAVKPADLIPVHLLPLPRLPAGAKATLPSSQ
mgnify:CR=1 FL=1